jgi:hypothetical protein
VQRGSLGPFHRPAFAVPRRPPRPQSVRSVVSCKHVTVAGFAFELSDVPGVGVSHGLGGHVVRLAGVSSEGDSSPWLMTLHVAENRLHFFQCGVILEEVGTS